ncbi:hypothetical protein IJ541_01415 [bacterium]|nr:hypothetical protein [bacterium]
MVNIHGASNAYHMKYVQPHAPQIRAPRGGRTQQTVIIQQTNNYGGGYGNWDMGGFPPPPKPSGFERFMGSFLTGFGIGTMLVKGFQLLGDWLGFGKKNKAGNVQNQTIQNNNNTSSMTDLQRLEKLFSGHGFQIIQNGDGTYSATDKNGKLVGDHLSYDEMCKKLGESNTKETQGTPAKENDDGGKVQDDAGGKVQDDGGGKAQGGGGSASAAGKGSGASRSASPQGWYRAQGNGNNYEHSATDIKKVEAESAQKHQSNAQVVVTQHILKSKMGGTLNAQQINQLTQEVIKKNPSVFNADGSFKKGAQGTVQVDKLDLPTMDWIKTNILGEQSDAKGPNSATGKAMSTKTQAGNTQYNANKAAQEGYRETFRKGIFYDEKTKTHYQLQKDGTYKPLKDVKMVMKDGSWIDNKGKTHKEAVDGQNNTQSTTKTKQDSSKDLKGKPVQVTVKPGKYPTATVNGKTYTGISSGVSFSPSTKQQAQLENLKQQLQADGYTNVTLQIVQ